MRGSTQILDFLGDIGGFKEALLIILVTFGEYFSAKFFIAQVGEELYSRKKPKNKKAKKTWVDKEQELVDLEGG